MNAQAQAPVNETKRIAALRRYEILDSAPERVFDDFAFLASTICEAPIALMTLVDTDRQWFKARIGLEVTETPREHAFCAHTILGTEVMVVENASHDERFANNPLVTGDPNIRFYAGAPLIDGEGNALGSLCVIDRESRSLSPNQNKALQALARQVISQLELRRTSAELAAALSDVKALQGLLPICAHCKVVRDDSGFWHSVESYFTTHTDATFSHGICPDCVKLHFPEVHGQLYADEKTESPPLS